MATSLHRSPTSEVDCPAWFEPAGSIRDRQFADQMHQLLGADFEPDPAFLRETWSSGLPAAAENWYRRYQSRVEQERQRRAHSELEGRELLAAIL